MSEDDLDSDSEEEEDIPRNPNRPVYQTPVVPVVNTDGAWFEERAKFIPLRLTLSERKFLRLVEASLQVSDYTGLWIYDYSCIGCCVCVLVAT